MLGRIGFGHFGREITPRQVASNPRRKMKLGRSFCFFRLLKWIRVSFPVLWKLVGRLAPVSVSTNLSWFSKALFFLGSQVVWWGHYRDENDLRSSDTSRLRKKKMTFSFLQLFWKIWFVLCGWLRSFTKWFLRKCTRLCELQRICYGNAPGASRILGIGKEFFCPDDSCVQL